LYRGPNSEHPGIVFSYVLLLGRTVAIAVTVMCKFSETVLDCDFSSHSQDIIYFRFLI